MTKQEALARGLEEERGKQVGDCQLRATGRLPRPVAPRTPAELDARADAITRHVLAATGKPATKAADLSQDSVARVVVAQLRSAGRRRLAGRTQVDLKNRLFRFWVRTPYS